MRTYTRFSPAALLLSVGALLPVATQAVVPIVGTSPAMSPVTINMTSGDQFDPHVSAEWVVYTDDIGIRYYNFSTGIDAAIPRGTAARDLLSDVSGSKIVFSRVTVGVGTAVMVFDASTPTVAPIEVNPATGTTRIGAAIGGNTVAYIDFGLEAHGELVISDLSLPFDNKVQITSDTAADGNPSVSPDGNTVVWEHCDTSLTNCDIWQAQAVPQTNGTRTWSTSVTANTASPEANPDTNGQFTAAGNGQNGQIVFDSQRGSNPDIFWRPVAGGDEVQLEMAGLEGNPSVAGRYIAFESRASLLYSADIYVYDMVDNTLYQITDTPAVNEQLNDIAELSDSQCATPGLHCLRVVWASDEDGFDQRNIRGATFELAFDTVAPVLNVPTTITVHATTAGNAVVNYSVTATDDQTPHPTVNCAPASGSAFAIGTTQVNCTATDAVGNSATASFSVVVLVDSIAPILILPPTFTLNATSPAGAPLSYTVSARDDVTSSPAVVCSPPSGSTFAIGTTVVQCTATDAAGNSSSGTFNVVVIGAPPLCVALNAGIDRVKALSGTTLTPAQATQLITYLKQLKGNLGCPY